MKAMKNVLLILLVVVPVVAIIAATMYFEGIRKYGSPKEYRAEQERVIQTRRDSLRIQENVLTPEAVGDSVFMSMDDHATVFEETKQSYAGIDRLQATLDSLRGEREAIQQKEIEIMEREGLLQQEQAVAMDENITSLAKIYDNMKTDRAVPLIIEMNDTLAVRIISLMEDRNASKLLAGIAEVDINKATHLNAMLAEMGIQQ